MSSIMTALLEGRSPFSSLKIIEYFTLCMIIKHITPFLTDLFFKKLALNIACVEKWHNPS